MEHTVNIVPDKVKIGSNVFLCIDCNNEIRLLFDGQYFSSPDTKDVIRIEYVGDVALLPHPDFIELYKPTHIEDEPEYKEEEEYIKEPEHIPVRVYIIAAAIGAVISSVGIILLQHIRW